MQEPQKNEELTMADTFHLIYFLANVHATCLTPFLRSGFGVEHPGIYGVFTMLLILVVAGLGQSPATLIFFFLWLGVLLYRRAETFILLRRGVPIHSRCVGYPWLVMRFPFVRQVLTATGVIEPLLCVAVAMPLLLVSPPLALLVGGGLISLLVRYVIDTEIVRKRLQAMRDAHIEQEFYSRRFRQR